MQRRTESQKDKHIKILTDFKKKVAQHLSKPTFCVRISLRDGDVSKWS